MDTQQIVTAAVAGAGADAGVGKNSTKKLVWEQVFLFIE